MSIESEILRIQRNVSDAYASVADMGGKVPIALKSVNLPDAIRSIPQGGPAGPDGNPIGTVIAYTGTTAPKDYLICDGSTHLISDYPDLADFFQAQFGEKEHFGGDGVTNFAVPTISGDGVVINCIKATEAEPYENIYSLEETVVGRWIDGRPLYRKTIQTTSPSSLNVSTGVLELPMDHAVKKTYGHLFTINNDEIFFNFYNNSTDYAFVLVLSTNMLSIKIGHANYMKRPCVITIEYTKTTDPSTIAISAMKTINHESALQPDKINFAHTTSIS